MRRFLHTASLTGPLSLVKRAARCYGWGMAKNDLEAVLYVRVTDADRKRIAKAAEKAGFASDSEWVRQAVKKVLDKLDGALAGR